MIEIQLTKGKAAIVDDIDADLAEFKWCTAKGTYTFYGKRAVQVSNNKQKTVLMHRVILERILDRPLEVGEMPDHENRNGLDNRRENIRLASRANNLQNTKRRKDNTSGYKGVYFCQMRKAWVAHICINKKRTIIGKFDTPEAAYIAYCEAAEKHFGQFARFS